MFESRKSRIIYWVFFGLALALSLLTLHWTFVVAPVEAQMGIVQKIFYFHVPAAIAMQCMFVTAGIASLIYLVRENKVCDRLAASTAEIGVLMAIFVLVTGPLWARKAWGTYWEWEPRLTLTLVVFFMYVAFLALRGFGGRDDMSKRIAAGLAVAGLPGIYLVRVAVTKWRGTHPRVVWTGGLKNPDFKIAFALGCFAFACLAVCLVWQRYRLERARDEVDEVVLDMMERDLLEDEL